MPTQIPVQPQRSWMVAAVAALTGSLLAAVMISATELIVVWAYSWF